jgi:hypothetical protein
MSRLSPKQPGTKLRFQIVLSRDVARQLANIGKRERRNRSNTLEYLVEAEHRRSKEMA